MICVDTKFFSHLIECLETQKNIHLKPYKEKVLLQDKIDKTVTQCKQIVEDEIAEEKKSIRKKALHVPPDSSLFNESVIGLEGFVE